jgi:hypothetical protein
MLKISSIEQVVTVPRPVSSRVQAGAVSIGEQLVVWRKLHGLTAAQVCLVKPAMTLLEARDGRPRDHLEMAEAIPDHSSMTVADLRQL